MGSLYLQWKTCVLILIFGASASLVSCGNQYIVHIIIRRSSIRLVSTKICHQALLVLCFSICLIVTDCINWPQPHSFWLQFHKSFFLVSQIVSLALFLASYFLDFVLFQCHHSLLCPPVKNICLSTPAVWNTRSLCLFLPRDATQSAVLLWQVVCLSVCP